MKRITASSSSNSLERCKLIRRERNRQLWLAVGEAVFVTLLFAGSFWLLWVFAYAASV